MNNCEYSAGIIKSIKIIPVQNINGYVYENDGNLYNSYIIDSLILNDMNQVWELNINYDNVSITQETDKTSYSVNITFTVDSIDYESYKEINSYDLYNKRVILIVEYSTYSLLFGYNNGLKCEYTLNSADNGYNFTISSDTLLFPALMYNGNSSKSIIVAPLQFTATYTDYHSSKSSWDNTSFTVQVNRTADEYTVNTISTAYFTIIKYDNYFTININDTFEPTYGSIYTFDVIVDGETKTVTLVTNYIDKGVFGISRNTLTFENLGTETYINYINYDTGVSYVMDDSLKPYLTIYSAINYALITYYNKNITNNDITGNIVFTRDSDGSTATLSITIKKASDLTISPTSVTLRIINQSISIEVTNGDEYSLTVSDNIKDYVKVVKYTVSNNFYIQYIKNIDYSQLNGTVTVTRLNDNFTAILNVTLNYFDDGILNIEKVTREFDSTNYKYKIGIVVNNSYSIDFKFNNTIDKICGENACYTGGSLKYNELILHEAPTSIVDGVADSAYFIYCFNQENVDLESVNYTIFPPNTTEICVCGCKVNQNAFKTIPFLSYVSFIDGGGFQESQETISCFSSVYNIKSIKGMTLPSSCTSLINCFNTCTLLENLPDIDTSNIQNMNNIVAYCYNLQSFNLNMSNVTQMSYPFSNDVFLDNITLDLPNLLTTSYLLPSHAFRMEVLIPKAENVSNMVSSSYIRCLTLDMTKNKYNNIFITLASYLRTLDNKSEWYTFISNLTNSTKLNNEALMRIINNLHDYSSETPSPTPTLRIGNTNLNKLSTFDKQIAIDKGWSLI